MPVIWFVRHGESESNANLPTIHPAHSALTAKGRAEAQAVVQTFKQKPSLIVVSPFLRAQQTAEPTIAHFSPIVCEEWPVFEFTYLDPVHYFQTTGEERAPIAHSYWQRNDPYYKDGGVGESIAELMARVEENLQRFQAHSADFMVVFTHGLFFRALLWYCWMGYPATNPETMQRFRHFLHAVSFPNCGICRTVFSPDSAPYFSPFDTSHLLGIGRY